MIKSANNTEPIEKLQTYVLNNWSAVMLSLHSEIVDGCSAEGHVSHILSDRLSSRPMGWSQRGADRMSKLRCYEKNYGREKIIDLVKYSREQRNLKSTGTDDAIIKQVSLRQIKSRALQSSEKLHRKNTNYNTRISSKKNNQYKRTFKVNIKGTKTHI